MERAKLLTRETNHSSYVWEFAIANFDLLPPMSNGCLSSVEVVLLAS